MRLNRYVLTVAAALAATLLVISACTQDQVSTDRSAEATITASETRTASIDEQIATITPGPLATFSADEEAYILSVEERMLIELTVTPTYTPTLTPTPTVTVR